MSVRVTTAIAGAQIVFVGNRFFLLQTDQMLVVSTTFSLLLYSETETFCPDSDDRGTPLKELYNLPRTCFVQHLEQIERKTWKEGFCVKMPSLLHLEYINRFTSVTINGIETTSSGLTRTRGQCWGHPARSRTKEAAGSC